MSFYSKDELKQIGFKSIGKDVLISSKASIYSPEKISIGDNVRIDDFCILSGSIKIGSHIHISAGVYLYGGEAGIEIGNFSGISSKSIIYAVSDDFSGNYLVGSMISKRFRNIEEREVVIGTHVQIGANCVILPGVKLGEGIAVGASSLVNSSLEEWSINLGVPAKKIKEREKNMLKLEEEFLKEKGEI